MYIGQNGNNRGFYAYTNVGVSASDALAEFHANNTNFDQPVLQVENYGSGASLLVNDSSSDTTPFIIDASGNVGIGTSAPNALLEIVGGDMHLRGSGMQFKVRATGGADRVSLGNNGGANGTVFLYNNSDVKTVELTANGTSFFNGGNVGIGTATPGSAALDIVGTTTANSAVILPRGTTANRPAGTNGMIRYNSNTNVFEGFENGSWKTMIVHGPVTCPTNFTLVGTPGKRGAFCITTAEQGGTGVSFSAATNACEDYATSDGSHATICSYPEWHKACRAGVLTNGTGNWEWINQLPNSGWAMSIGNSSCDDWDDAAVSTNYRYRCCIK